jgi:hypothetical protein
LSYINDSLYIVSIQNKWYVFIVFTKYFKLLDEFNGKFNAVFIGMFKEALAELYIHFLNDINPEENEESLEHKCHLN